jgi:deaminated glutathione amidase
VLVARYDKIHLFGFEMGGESYSEARTIEPGNEGRDRRFTPFGRSGCRSVTTCAFPSSTARWAMST